jgi:hypothetical protein
VPRSVIREWETKVNQIHGKGCKLYIIVVRGELEESHKGRVVCAFAPIF